MLAFESSHPSRSVNIEIDLLDEFLDGFLAWSKSPFPIDLTGILVSLVLDDLAPRIQAIDLNLVIGNRHRNALAICEVMASYFIFFGFLST